MEQGEEGDEKEVAAGAVWTVMRGAREAEPGRAEGEAEEGEDRVEEAGE